MCRGLRGRWATHKEEAVTFIEVLILLGLIALAAMCGWCEGQIQNQQERRKR